MPTTEQMLLELVKKNVTASRLTRSELIGNKRDTEYLTILLESEWKVPRVRIDTFIEYIRSDITIKNRLVTQLAMQPVVTEMNEIIDVWKNRLVNMGSLREITRLALHQDINAIRTIATILSPLVFMEIGTVDFIVPLIVRNREQALGMMSFLARLGSRR